MEALAHRLLLLTLALDEALSADSWSEADRLLQDRAQVLRQMEGKSIPESARPAFEQVRDAEARTSANLDRARKAAGGKLRQVHQARKALVAYGQHA